MRDYWLTTYKTHARLSSFQRLCERTQERMAQFLRDCAAPYCGWSGGKDSLALLILLARMGRQEVPIFTQGDDLDWPDKRDFCAATMQRLGFTDYTYALSTVSALDQFAALSLGGDDAVRGTFSHVIRRYVADRQRTGVLMGLRAEESSKRRFLRKTQGLQYRVKSGELRAIPLADWSGLDIFALIVSTATPYFHVYDCDDERAPHEIRLSWMLNPTFLNYGQGLFLKRHYPEQFRRLAALNPNLHAYG